MVRTKHWVNIDTQDYADMHLCGECMEPMVPVPVAVAEVAVVVGMTENEVQQILDEAAELASRAIGRPPPGAGPPSTGNSPPS